MQKSSAKSIAARRLKAAGKPEELDRILQDECRRRADKKLAATLSCPDFRFPTSLSAEQCTSDDIAEIHAAMVPEGARVVDLTCGLGIDAFHIARKASDVLAIDLDPIVAAAIEPNAAALGLTNVKSVAADCRQWLNETEEQFDIAFIDPARRGENGKRLYSLHDCQPDVIEILEDIFRVAPRIIVKMSPMLDISAIIGELPGLVALHVIGTTGECKELVADVRKEHTDEPYIEIHTAGEQTLRFYRSDMSGEQEFAREIREGDTIGEPWPAVAKAAPRGGVIPGAKLHPDTNLWLNPGAEFPGKLYKVTRIEAFSSSNLKRLTKEGIKASVAVKNLPMSADDLRKRLKARESATTRLIGATIYPTKRLLIFLESLEMR